MDLDQFFVRTVLKEGYSEESALFLRTLIQTARQGHLCYRCPKAPPLPPSVLEEGLGLQPKAPVVWQQDRYYLQRNWVYETHLLEQIKRLKALPAPAGHAEEVFKKHLEEVKLLPAQKRAVEGAFESAFSLICGGPGTGKTYTAGVLTRLLIASRTKREYKIALAAPTGKAASHLQAVLGQVEAKVEAMTLHRLLKVKPGENRLFSTRRVQADLVIVDEASMIDVPLLAQLLESIGPATRLVLMGDPDQLPPVEAGSLFSEMAHLFGSRLQTSMRTDDTGLQNLAQMVNRGEFPVENGYRLPWEFDRKLGERVFSTLNPPIYNRQPDPIECLKELQKFRILGALRQGPFGIDWLNRYIVAELGKRIRPGEWWAIPIMITSNQPELDLYNGTCGVLIGQSRGGIFLRDGIAYFPQRVSYSSLPPFEPAFCLSIHKSQGSEFERVLALFPPNSETFGREAFYTAITRAKKGVELVVSEEVLRAMLAQRSQKISGFTARF